MNTPDPFFEAGRNCKVVARADRMTVLRSGKSYFDAFVHALESAQDNVLIVGWDVHTTIKMRPDADPELTLMRCIKRVACARPNLTIRILSWGFSEMFEFESRWLPHWRITWSMPDNVIFQQHDHRAFAAAHHQKLVVVDDTLAFGGGFDLSICRWDSVDHAPMDEHRVTPYGDPYEPFHDYQYMVDGPAARALGVVAYERWADATGQTIDPSTTEAPGWLEHIEPMFTDIDVAIARTHTAPDRANIEEIHALMLDAIKSATDILYMEQQYATAQRLIELLGRRLQEPRGPHVIIVVPDNNASLTEEMTIGKLANRSFAYLRERDAHGRLFIGSPVSRQEGPDAEWEDIFVHAKVMFVDDDMMIAGSANMSNRSMGLDTECSIGVRPHTPENRQALVTMRDTLVGAQLGLEHNEWAALLARHDGHWVRAIEQAQEQATVRNLVAVEIPVWEEFFSGPPSDTMIYDPGAPIAFETPILFQPNPQRQAPKWIRGLALGIGLALVGAVAWRRRRVMRSGWEALSN